MQDDMSVINLLPLSSEFILFASFVKLDLHPLNFFPLTAHTEALSTEGTEQDWNTGDKEIWGRDMWLQLAVCSKQEGKKGLWSPVFEK